uniref:Uncharacterized protein n=1 Tax=Peronospora matthiolae TaxID=2874970 RepID=A0AAV1VAR1_9STRA
MRAINIVVSVAVIRHGTQSEALATAVLGHKGVSSLSETINFLDSDGRLADSASHRHLRGYKSTDEERNMVEPLARALIKHFPELFKTLSISMAHVKELANVIAEHPTIVLGALIENGVTFDALRAALDPLLATFEMARGENHFRPYLSDFIATYKTIEMNEDVKYCDKLLAELLNSPE